MKQKVKIIIFIFLIITGILIWKNHNIIESLKEELTESQDLIYKYQDALNEANDNIEQVNSYIEDAQGYAWSSYEDMGWALDNLQTVETVDEPYSHGFWPQLPNLRLPKLPNF